MKKLRFITTVLFVLISWNGLFSQTVSVIEKELTGPWLGFGYNQWGHARMEDGVTFKPWDDALWNMTENRIKAIKPALVRLPLMREWFNMDDAGNELPIGTYNWESKYMKAFYKSMDLYKNENMAVLSGLWHSAYEPGGKEPIDFYISKGENGFARLQADLIDYLVNTKGYTNIKFYTPTNEPLGSISDFNVWKTMMKNLHEELTNRGLPTNILIGADSWGDWTWLPARENKNELIGYDFHNYLNDTPDDTFTLLFERNLEKNLTNTINRIYSEDNTNKPVIVSEMAPIGVGYIDWPVVDAPAHCKIDTYEYGLNFAEYGIQLMRAGAASGLAWGLDGFDQNKNAGMWNNAGTYGGMKLRPWYYTWQLMCRYFPAGSVILKMSEQENRKDLRIVGAKINTNDYTFAITNRRTDALSEKQQITIKAPGTNKTFYVYTYSQNNYGNGVDLSLSYETIQTENLNDHGITLEISSETCIILTTLPPLVPGTNPISKTAIIDFESTINYGAIINENYNISINESTNPRKRAPNISDKVCRITQRSPADPAFDPNNAYIRIIPDSLWEINSEKRYISFQIYRNDENISFTFGVKCESKENIYGAIFSSPNRTWKDYSVDLTPLIGEKIESIVIFPNTDFDKTDLNTEEYSYFDNIKLSNDPTDVRPGNFFEIPSDPDHTSLLNFNFEYKNTASVPYAGTRCGTVSIQTNPSKQEENESDKACKTTYTFPGRSGCEAKEFNVSFDMFRPVMISEKTPYFNFQALKSNYLSEIALEIKLKDIPESIRQVFTVDTKREWKNFTADLSEYSGKIIEKISLYPNIQGETIESGTDECYFDNLNLSEKKISSGIINPESPVDHRFYIQNNILYILDAEGSSLSVFEPNGRMIRTVTVNSTDFSVSLKPGIYILRINQTHYKISIR